MIWLLAGVVLLLIVYSVLGWLKTAQPAEVKKAGVVFAIAFLILISLLLIFTGRVTVAWPFLLGAAGLYVKLKRAFGLWTGAKRFFDGRKKGDPSRSEVRTSHLFMTLDHDHAELDGEIIDGRFKGMRLSDLSQQQVIEKYQELLVVDGDGARLLEGYLDKCWPDWQQSQGNAGYSQNSAVMSREEAMKLLGLQGSVGREEIVMAHRNLMRRVHPDQGGNSYLAMKLNEARDVLLNNSQNPE